MSVGSALRRAQAIGAVALAALAVTGASVDGSGTPVTTTSTPPASSPTTSVAPTTTAPADPRNGLNWLHAAYASPCDGSPVELVGGTAFADGRLIVLEDVRPLPASPTNALAVLACHDSSGRIGVGLSLVSVEPPGAPAVVAHHEVAGAAELVAFDGTTVTIERPAGTAAEGSCCAPLIERQRISIGGDGLSVVDEGQRSAFTRTVATTPALGRNAEVVRSSVPGAALCYRWSGSYWPQDPDPDAAATPLVAPSAELQTLRLALIHVTGRWIEPAPEVTPEMAAVVRAYQESRGLVADGVVGPQTAAALTADLGCPGNGSFRQIDPPELGPRRFATVNDLTAATAGYATRGTSGNPSLDALLRAAAWDGSEAMFLGCSRRESPVTGVTCSWSGATPLQLVGLVDDVATPGVAGFSILYARSAAVG